MSRPTDFFNYKNGVLTSDGVSLYDIAEITGTPVYVYSTNALLSPLKELQKGLKGIDYMVCFAVKSNSNLGILKLLADAGAGMDLVSGGELFRVAMAGVDPKKTVFSGVGKTPGEIVQALQYGGEGIFSFNVESEPEIALISEIATQLKTKATVALRFNPDVDAKTHPYISTGLKKNKFGIEREEIIRIARNIQNYPGISLGGISIHIGSQLLSLAPLKDAFTRLKNLINELDEILPTPIHFVDLGGGVGITYKNEKAPSLSQYCELIRKNFGPTNSKKSTKRPLKVLIEPGRSISGNAGVLLTEVLYRKKRKAKDFLIIDAAMNDLIRPSLYGSYHEITSVLENQSKGPKSKVDVVGPVCESGDCFATDRSMSKNTNQGDLLAILSAGAYGFVMSGNYNTRPRAPEVLVKDGTFQIIRERENYDDLIRGERFFEESTPRRKRSRNQ